MLCRTRIAAIHIAPPLIAVSLCLAATSSVWADDPDTRPIRALQRFPDLRDYFPFGFWYAQAPMDETLAGEFREPYPARQEKLFHHLARHHVNALVTANRAATPQSLQVAGKFGMRVISSAEMLHGHVNHAGELTGQTSMQQVLDQARKHAQQTGPQPHLLAYLVFDEPRPQVAPKIQQVLDVMRAADPRHPAIYTHSDMPLDKRRVAEWNMLQSQDVLLSDCYSIAARNGRDPWLYGDVHIQELRRANPDALQWPIVQAFTKPYTIWALPTRAELRVMVYHTIASGAKGMFFFTTGQAYLGSWARRQWFYRGAGNPWYGHEALMDEIGNMGAHLTTAGPLLIPLRYAPVYPVHVGQLAAPLAAAETFQAYVLSGRAAGPGLRGQGELQRAAIHVGAFRGGDYDVLVVHNNDPWQRRRAAVTLSNQRDILLDLLTLEQVPLKTNPQGRTFPVDFQPGDGRLYLAGDRAAVERARNSVLRRRAEHDRHLLEWDSELVHRAGADVSAVRTLLQQSAADQDVTRASQQIIQARTALHASEQATANYVAVRNMIAEARNNFDRIHELLHTAPIHPLDEDSAPELRELGRRVIEMSRSFSANENLFRKGQLDVTRAYVLRRETAQFLAAVRDYRPGGLIEANLVVVELSPGVSNTPDVETRALARRLRWMFKNVNILSSGPDGSLTRVDGNPAELGQPELIWVHVGGRSGAAQVRYCVSANLSPVVPYQGLARVLREFRKHGGGLILSGLGGCLVTELGLEKYPPNQRYWGTMLVPGHGPSRHRSPNAMRVKSLGLKPRVVDHPLFAGLPSGGFATMEFNAAELLTEAVWRRPEGQSEHWRAPYWPNQGRVLAGYWADGADIPDCYATVIEYPAASGQDGTVIVLGGGFDPRVSTNRPRRGPHYDRLLRNLVEHCGRNK